MYAHYWHLGDKINLPVGKAVCVGRNYAAHARELNNPVPTDPIIFIKPSTSFCTLAPQFSIPQGRGEVHHEIEVALLIGKSLCRATEQEALAAIVGFGLGLDLTLRQSQQKLKEAGHPWELAKAFDDSLPLSPFLPSDTFETLNGLKFSLVVNGVERQQGNTNDMIFAIAPLLGFISQHFTLLPGDVVMTGTPSGVAALNTGDDISLRWDNGVHFDTRVS